MTPLGRFGHQFRGRQTAQGPSEFAGFREYPSVSVTSIANLRPGWFSVPVGGETPARVRSGGRMSYGREHSGGRAAARAALDGRRRCSVGAGDVVFQSEQRKKALERVDVRDLHPLVDHAKILPLA